METIPLSSGTSMHAMRKCLRALGVAICILLVPWLTVVCQSMPDPVHELFKKAEAYELAFNDEAALTEYLVILSIQEDNVPALIRASRKLTNIAGRDVRHRDAKTKIEYALALGLKAVALSENNLEARLSYVIALGLLSSASSSPSEKISNARLIREEADRMIRIDSSFAPAHFILGKWHLSIATLSWYEKIACSFVFRNLSTTGSLEQALECFDRALFLEPGNILFSYNKALAHYYSGEVREARQTLLRATACRPKDPDDSLRIEQCKSLLEQTKKF